MKYISYKITIGGDSGFRCSNQDEWCSSGSILLFDASKWTNESIAKAMKEIWHAYWNDRGEGIGYGNKYGRAETQLKLFFKNNEGVFFDKDKSFSFYGVDEDRIIVPNPEDEVVSWELDGSTVNYDYHRD